MIEDYLENNLSADDRYAFVEELSKNKVLQKEVHKHQVAYSIIERGIEESLRKKLEVLSKKNDPEQESKGKSSSIIMISIIILFILVAIYLISRNS